MTLNQVHDTRGDIDKVTSELNVLRNTVFSLVSPSIKFFILICDFDRVAMSVFWPGSFYYKMSFENMTIHIIKPSSRFGGHIGQTTVYYSLTLSLKILKILLWGSIAKQIFICYQYYY